MLSPTAGLLQDIGPLVKGLGISISSILGFHIIGCIWHWAGMVDATVDIDGDLVAGWVNESIWAPLSWDRYTQSVYSAIYGAVSIPTVTEMFVLVLLHFLINGFMYGMLTANLASLLVSMSASRQRYTEVSSSSRNTLYEIVLSRHWCII